MILVSILLLIIIIIVEIAVHYFGLELRLGNFSILVVCCFPFISEKVVLFSLLNRFLISVVRCLTRMLIKPCSVMIMDKLPIFIFIICRSWTILRAVGVLVVTTHQKVISPHLCTHWLRILSRLEAILVHSTTPLISLSHCHILQRRTTRNRYLIYILMRVRNSRSMIIRKEKLISTFLLKDATEVVVCEIAYLDVLWVLPSKWLRLICIRLDLVTKSSLVHLVTEGIFAHFKTLRIWTILSWPIFQLLVLESAAVKVVVSSLLALVLYLNILGLLLCLHFELRVISLLMIASLIIIDGSCCLLIAYQLVALTSYTVGASVSPLNVLVIQVMIKRILYINARAIAHILVVVLLICQLGSTVNPLGKRLFLLAVIIYSWERLLSVISLDRLLWHFWMASVARGKLHHLRVMILL